MGQLVSRFRRKKTSVTGILEQLEKEIKTLEEYQQSTERRQKRLVGSFLLYSFVLYIALGTLLYFYWFPSTLRDQSLYAIPILLFPLIIWLLKTVLQKYFRWKIEANSELLTDLLRQRRSVLNDVKENETYKKAKEILEKFDPEYKLQEKQKKDAEALLAKKKEALSGMELRRRSFPARSTFPPLPTTASARDIQSSHPAFQPNNRMRPPPGPPMARPILPRERGVRDRLVDYLIGDGPNNRYALICFQCQSHNGMALKEEFEYIAFRCCYCYVPNPARKQRPWAPSLPISLPPTQLRIAQSPPAETKEEKEEVLQKGESEAETVVEDEGTTLEQTDNAQAQDEVSSIAESDAVASNGIVENDETVSDNGEDETGSEVETTESRAVNHTELN